MADKDKSKPDYQLVLPEEDTRGPAPSSTSAEVKPKPKPKAKKPAAEKPQKAKSQAALWVVLIITLLLVLALGAAAYWYIWDKDNSNQLLISQQQLQQSALEALNDENGTLQQQLVALENSKQELAASVNALMQKTDTMEVQTEQLISQLNDMEGRRPSDWLLAEADYLVRMAGRKIWLEKDINTAILLLRNADERLQELSDPSVIPIRGYIAEDIQSLRQVNTVDRTQLALSLSGLLSKADDLPLHTFSRPGDAAENEGLSESIDDWQSNLAKVWHDIVDDFISVSHDDAPVAPMMSAEQQWLYKEQLKLQIMQAQSAAIAAQNDLFNSSLQNAIGLLNDKFDTQSPGVQGALSTLTSLTNTNIQESLPESLRATAPLQRLMEQRINGAYGNSAEVL
ncbi:uroporphyrinogen-III C-methyltransferase [Alteromonas sp. C1M14]|uniref:uroporphyrinogen-III C-methyltransferase n=1 Tax=Alteromonas sp. C1M14 TaxID=2841567 RepID=UPI001C085EDE|nr:uroporphyrinogen-III C-methyltransferase [Alteromonas sp. C1M14]MBU2979959.1 uroporphyrinogen-III C-methyltransferase [Alteromonas sp. C1M14]